MRKLRLTYLAACAAAAGLMQVGSVYAQSVDALLEEDAEKVADAVTSQNRVNATADATDQIVVDFKQVNKQIEGLKAYNAQLELQIKDQQRALADLDASIEEASRMEQYIAPLMEQMIEALDQLVELDLPFNYDQRSEAVQRLRSNIGRSDLTLAEKFRQVLEVYKIESDYSNNIDTYSEVVNVDGVDLDVDILRVGRIALMYKTKDQSKAGFWNRDTGQWEALDSGDYRTPLANLLKIAKKQASIDILTVPVMAPEAAQ